MTLITLSTEKILSFQCGMLLFILLIITPRSMFAEGSKELAPNPSDRLFLYLNGEFYNNFGRYDGDTDQRLFFHVADPNNEQVFLGFNEAVTSGHYPCRGVTIASYFRIKDPNGNIVYPVAGNNRGQLLDGNSANITTKAQVEAGPMQIVGANGYDAYVFDPSGLAAGDYYIEFSASADVSRPDIALAIEHWDITVASKDPAPLPKPGRVFSTNWAFYSPSISCGNDLDYNWFDRPFNGNIHVYSKEGFVNKVDFNNSGFQAAAFNLYFNETGANNSGDIQEDRKSIVGLGAQLALQKIFLNNPDLNTYPSGVYGTLTSNTQLHDCNPNKDACILIQATEPGQIRVLLDLEKSSGDFIYDHNSQDIILTYKIEPEVGETSPFNRCIPWDRIDGLGNMLPAENNYDMLITYQQGVYHLPVYDVEYVLNGFTTTNVRPLPPSGIYERQLFYDDSNIPFESGTAGNQVELNGCSMPCHTWSNQAYGNENTINTWFFADEEKELDAKNSLCIIEAIDDLVVTSYETPISISAIMNDISNSIDTSSLAIFEPSANGGIINVGNNGVIEYTPINGFSGLDSFQYQICYDVIPQNSLCDLATIYVRVGSVTETDCTDGIDNDNDGFVDCDDSDCQSPNVPEIFRKQ